MTRATVFAGLLALTVLPGCGGSDEVRSGDDRPAGTAASKPRDIAFVRYPGRANDRFSDVFVTSADGCSVANVTNTRNVSEGSPAWSPDGARIAFSRQEGSSSAIWVINSDGSGPARLTRGRRSVAEQPAWAPDGERIAYVRGAGHRRDIWVMSAEGDEQTNVTRTRTADEYAPAWSPDGKRIVFQSSAPADTDRSILREEIAVIDADGGGRRSLTSGPGFEDLYVGSPAFSPDGRRIAFLALRAGRALPRVWMMNADGSDPAPLGRRARATSGPSFSPDGTRIAYADGRAIYTIRTSGRGRSRLPGGKLNDQDPAWSPAGGAARRRC